MSFRQRAAEIRERGVAERGNFTPHGVPLKMYQYWARNSHWSVVPDRENFCHYWRVVTIWAPLKAITRGFNKAFVNLFGALVATLLVAAAIVLVVVTTGTWLDLLLGVGIGLSVVALIVGTLFGLAYIRENIWKRSWSYWFEAHFGTIMIIFGTSLFTALLASVVLIEGWAVLGLIALSIAGAGVFVGALFFSVDFIVGRRERAKDVQQQERLDYLLEHGDYPPTPGKEPGRISRFFSGLADFLIFAGQIVRVKKWKICPVAEVPLD